MAVNTSRTGRLLAGASRLTVTSAVTLTVLGFVTPVLAQTVSTVPDPATGDALAVRTVFDGAALTADGRLVILDPQVGAQVPDPADASVTVEVTEVLLNATTGLAERLVLTDGRTIDVVRDVSTQAAPSGTPASGSAINATPLPAADQRTGTFGQLVRGSGGRNGDDSTAISRAENGGNGETGTAVTINRSGNVENNQSDPIAVFRMGIGVQSANTDGGDGGDGAFLLNPNGGNGGNGARATTVTVNSSASISIAPDARFGIWVASLGGSGGDAGNGGTGFVSDGGDGGNGAAGGNIRVTNEAGGNITTRGNGNYAIFAASRGGRGGSGGDGGTAFGSSGGSAGSAGGGGDVRFTNSGAIFTLGNNAHGVFGQSIGGNGGGGGDAGGLVGFAGAGNEGGDGAFVEIDNRGLIVTEGSRAFGMLAQSFGGGGGDSGNAAGLAAIGASGGAGSDGGTLSTFNFGGSILTSGARSHAVVAQSVGGGGGSGGFAAGAVAIGSRGSGGGNGGGVTFVNGSGGLVATQGDVAYGVLAQSIGGGGGSGGSAGGVVSLGGSGGSGGSGGTVAVTNSATVLTEGVNSRAIVVQSIGGGGGDGAASGGAVSIGGSGSGAGNGNTATVLNGATGLVRTSGLGGIAIVAQSIGGGGGLGAGSGGAVSIGGSGGRGGSGALASVTSDGLVETSGDFARGILVQSIGGGGGDGGASGGAIAIGGRATSVGNGNAATITNTGTVRTGGAFSTGLQAQSIGGGGGTGGSGGGLITIGGSAGAGGRSGTVNVTNSGTIETGGDFSTGVYAQSVGGGGGDGGQAVSASAFVGVAVGGRGGSGGSGGTVNVTGGTRSIPVDGVARDLSGLVRTGGDFSAGIFAQSVGGGGGNGGAAVQATGGAFGAVSVAVGGAAGSGGSGGAVNVTGEQVVETLGAFSTGIFAQSVGGGGGNGGLSVAAAVSGGPVSGSVSVGVGGSGGSGGIGGEVTLDSSGLALTRGDFSTGIFAQSVGGGGGNGGFALSFAGAGAAVGAAAIPVGVGGSGGSGGRGGVVDLDFDGGLVTEGAFSNAMLAQSVGGGGGNGGFNISGAVAGAGAGAGGIAIGVGGTGGGGGNGGMVDSSLTGDVMTMGNFSTALITQAIGGSGGNGGYNVSASLGAAATGAGAVSVGIGGSGGGAGNGGTAISDLAGNLVTMGDFAGGILTQSVGGGGGNGALNVSGSLSAAGAGAGAVSVGIGGAGGGGGAGGTVTAGRTGGLETQGEGAYGFIAQSLGGGGGNGAVNVAGSITGAGSGSGNVSVGVGGAGGGAGAGGSVTATITGATITRGDGAEAIVAQSVGGGGGNGGVNVSAGLGLTAAGGGLGVGVGGTGGTGGGGGAVSLGLTGGVMTAGADAAAVLAQSVGGGGGNGGVNVTGVVTLAAGAGGSIGVGVGGKGGGGGAGGAASATINSDIATMGARSDALIVQSLGGGGGNGGVNVSGTINATAGAGGALSVGVGGFGGSGGTGGAATLTFVGSAVTAGEESTAVLVQSQGGGGGNGALNVSGAASFSTASAVGASVGIGGFGGTGGLAGRADAMVTGGIGTTGAGSEAVMVQSLGGGGGNGGVNFALGLSLATSTSVAGSVGIGGFGGGASAGGDAILMRSGATSSSGAGADAVVVQSLGGGGGRGGLNVAGGLGFSGSGAFSGAIGLGGFGGGGGAGGLAEATISGDVMATGLLDDRTVETEETELLFLKRLVETRVREGGSNGILVQSVGGGGGDGGVNISGGIAFSGGSGGKALSLGIGGFGGDGGAGGEARLTMLGEGAGESAGEAPAMVSAIGDDKAAIIVQSVGGGGGNGGLNIAGGITNSTSLTLGFGGAGGGGGTGGAVMVDANVMASAAGNGATGILAQSLGGGGGTGGINISGGILAGSGTTPLVTFGMGGSGGSGSRAGVVTATTAGGADVEGVGATGILAQSLGGGGGNGGLSIAGNLTAAKGFNVAIGIGGTGGTGADGGAVTLTAGGAVRVDGRGVDDADLDLVDRDDRATGVLAQSVGGGGGNGGVNISGAGANAGTPLVVGVGGSGGAGGAGADVLLTRSGATEVLGDNGKGVIAQSIGGGGGNAGLNILTSATLKAKFDVQLAIGGSGGEGSDGGAVDVIHSGDIMLAGESSTGLLAQSVGGGGGNAAANVNVSLVGNRAGNDGGAAPDTKTLDLALGGAPGGGSAAGAVTVTHSGSITMGGATSTGLLAQSIGGGGGNAAANYSYNVNDEGAISLALGRRGGSGGTGGSVTVTSDGSISTAGLGGHAVHAQSVGGGGGTSETSVFSAEGDRGGNDGKAKQSGNLELAFGLEGGEGAAAGAVSVTNNAMLGTSGERAHGVLAQSIGGGGGAGGAAFVDKFQELPDLGLDSAEDESSYSIAFQMGGVGGTGAAGSSVDVLNMGQISTTGARANAVLAQSIGGGGGEGGLAFNVDTPGRTNSRSLEIAQGGNGGVGAIAGAVTVDNAGILTTQGDEASAILAQSIGGGGGNAGLTGNFSLLRPDGQNNAATVVINRGGTGGTGAAAGAVRVDNRAGASIVTSGREAHGVHAQSIGGGGGNGSAILSGNAATGNESYAFGLNIGGDGGTGGTGGSVVVDNAGSIMTAGREAHGVFAQSIGGGGGNGGVSLAIGNLAVRASNQATQVMLALGGNGGAGNDAGAVTVSNSGTIATSGVRAHGIFAQSLGGGGGNAGIGIGISATTNRPLNVLTNVLGVLFGGRGGDGGQGGEVTVNHSGDIVATGRGAEAVLAESINGGGGGIALDLNGITSSPGGQIIPGVDGFTTPPLLTLFGGGAGLGDSVGERVTLNLTGTMRASGASAVGVSAQSVGGGGGRVDLDLAFVGDGMGAGGALGLDVGLGGEDSVTVDGGALATAHSGDIVAEGDDALGLLLQSIGGGGGRANLALSGGASELGAVALRLGGRAQQGARGGAVSHVQTGSLLAMGDGAIGALVQSIGGGAGLINFRFAPDAAGALAAPSEALGRFASLDLVSLSAGEVVPVDGTLVLGAEGGTGLDGGAASLEVSGDVMTTGVGAPGVVLQSIGGGGGVARLGGSDGFAITIGGSDGASGNGDAVSLVVGGMVATAGSASHGVVLQSIGGGGGAVFGAGPDSSIVLSSANSGDGGAVSLDLASDVSVTGPDSVAVVAQSLGGGGGLVDNRFFGSAGGAGAGGSITLALGGNVGALADGATAVRAQSAGGSGGGDIAVTLAEGRSLMSGLGGTALALDGGAANRFTNNGTVMTLDGLTGLAVSGTSGGDVIDNRGTLLGNVALGGGANGLFNREGATMVTGTTLDMGAAGNVFDNSGALRPGDVETLATTALSGSFVQTETGITIAEADLATNRFDAINASGTVAVSGAVDLRLLNAAQFTPGAFSARLFTGVGGASMSEVALRADNSVVLNLLGMSVEDGAVQVDYDLSFAPDAAIGNRADFGEYLNRVQAEGVSPALAETFSGLIGQQDEATYVDLLTQMGAEFYAEQTVHALEGAQAFGARVRQCGAAFDARLTDRALCAWAEFDYEDSQLDAQNGMPSVDREGKSFSGGAHYRLESGLSFALGVGFGDHRLDGYDGRWTARGNSKQLGAGIAYDIGKGRLGATVAYSDASYRSTRQLPGFAPMSANSRRDIGSLLAEATADYRFDFGNVSVRPSLGVGLVSLSGGDLTETGAEARDLVVAGNGDTFSWVLPSVELAYNAKLSSGWTVRPFVRAAVRQYLGDETVAAAGRFAADDSGADPFVAISPINKMRFEGEAGLAIGNQRGISVSAAWRMMRSTDRQSNAGTLRLSVPF